MSDSSGASHARDLDSRLIEAGLGGLESLQHGIARVLEAQTLSLGEIAERSARMSSALDHSTEEVLSSGRIAADLRQQLAALADAGKRDFVVLSGDTTPEALKTYVRENLANYKVPRSISVLPELPRNSTGKIDRRELKALADADGA